MSEKISVIPINKGFSQKYGVKIEYPLKQGLKLAWAQQYCDNASLVKIEYPLKQGLKLCPINTNAGLMNMLKQSIH